MGTIQENQQYQDLSLMYKDLKNLEDHFEKFILSIIEDTILIITKKEKKLVSPKIYYSKLDKFVTNEEYIEYESFFTSYDPSVIQTNLTSIF